MKLFLFCATFLFALSCISEPTTYENEWYVIANGVYGFGDNLDSCLIIQSCNLRFWPDEVIYGDNIREFYEVVECTPYRLVVKQEDESLARMHHRVQMTLDWVIETHKLGD